jgi:DNA processing protein
MRHRAVRGRRRSRKPREPKKTAQRRGRRADEAAVRKDAIRSFSPSHEDYPRRLRELSRPPAHLWIAGTLPRAPAIAIVGTRRADAPSIDFTERLARELAELGASVVSGGALGIDAAAHRGALRADGHTIVVQAAPLAEPYPRANRRLFARVLEAGGGWLSETPPGIAPQAYRFLARNRLIAALADAVVVVQAPARSGALSTARWARELARPVFAVPAAPWDPRSEGALELLATLARPCRDASDLAPALGLVAPQRELSFAAHSAELALSEDAEQVREALSSQPAHLDDLARVTALSVARVHAALVELLVAGCAREERGAWRGMR